MDWQPIETAPKDGTSVLMFYPCGRHDHEWNDFEGRYEAVMAVMACDDRGIWHGYYEATGPDGYPTHWMPLPPAPTSAPR